MKWNNHKEYEGKHAFMSPSNYHWLNYTDIVFESRYYSQYSQLIGTTVHQLAHDCISSRMKLSKHDVHIIQMYLWKAFIPKDAYDANRILTTLVPFVNDAIGFHMSSEILLFYNEFCFGTADAISYSDYDKTLRIHDLKSGLNPADMRQCHIYAALFCLEYNINPKKLKLIECRIYQNLEEQPVLVDQPSADYIQEIMDYIQLRSKNIESYLEREGR